MLLTVITRLIRLQLMKMASDYIWLIQEFTAEPQFVSQKELELFHKGELQKSEDPSPQERTEIIRQLVEADEYINTSTVTKEQLQKTSQAFKQPDDVELTHVLDAGFDSNDVFAFIDKELEDEFVIRLKISRNSNETYIDDKAKEKYVKIVNTEFANKERFPIQKVQIKGKNYQQASCLIEYDDITFEKETYTVVRITVNDRKGQKIFKESPRLLTNRKIETAGSWYLFNLSKTF